MRATAQVGGKVDEIELKVELVMTVREARELREQLQQQWPSWDLNTTLGQVLQKTVSRLESSHETT